MQETIDVTPKWSAIVPLMIGVLKNPKADPEAKKFVEVELIRLAKIADEANEKIKAERTKNDTK